MNGGTIVLLVEGRTEAAIKNHLKAFLDARRGDRSRVGLRIVPQHGGLKRRSVEGQAREWLREPSTRGVVALTDVYPDYASAEAARAEVGSWVQNDDRYRAAVAAHDFEAWLLVGWPALLERAQVPAQKPWHSQPESVNTGNPPAHRVKRLFEARARRSYSKPVDGKHLFEKLDLVEVAARCPEFKRFVNQLLDLAEYERLP